MTLNPKKPGADVVKQRLIESADVVLANMPQSGLRDIGIDYESLIKIKPDIILASSSAFGTSGPFADRVGFDGVAQAMSGNMYLTGESDQPSRNYHPYVDYTTGALNTIAILSAIMHRKETGEGQEVQGALLASALTVAGGTLIEQAVTGVNRVASGNRGQTAAPSDTYKTRDGWVLVSVVGQPLFERWANLMGEDEWLTDPRFVDDASRGLNSDIITERMQAWTSTQSTAEILDALDTARIPCGEVLSPQEALNHPQVEAMHYLEDIEYPGVEGTYPMPRTPIEFNKIGRPKSKRPPLLGEHTDTILAELGFSKNEISDFHEKRIV